MAAAWMTVRLGRTVHAQRSWEVIRRVGLIPQHPRPHATHANPFAQSAFNKGGSKRVDALTAAIPSTTSRFGPKSSTGSTCCPLCAGFGHLMASARQPRCGGASSGSAFIRNSDGPLMFGGHRRGAEQDLVSSRATVARRSGRHRTADGQVIIQIPYYTFMPLPGRPPVTVGGA